MDKNTRIVVFFGLVVVLLLAASGVFGRIPRPQMMPTAVQPTATAVVESRPTIENVTKTDVVTLNLFAPIDTPTPRSIKDKDIPAWAKTPIPTRSK